MGLTRLVEPLQERPGRLADGEREERLGLDGVRPRRPLSREQRRDCVRTSGTRKGPEVRPPADPGARRFVLKRRSDKRGLGRTDLEEPSYCERLAERVRPVDPRAEFDEPRHPERRVPHSDSLDAALLDESAMLMKVAAPVRERRPVREQPDVPLDQVLRLEATENRIDGVEAVVGQPPVGVASRPVLVE